MATGFKIADAYVEAHLDRDALREEIAGLPAELNSDVDRAGNDVGRRLGQGIGDGADGQRTGRQIIEDVDSTLGPGATRSGDDAGNRLSQGMDQALTRNSPLIAAAIGGALIAAQPVAVAGATSLFIAIAAVAEHSNAQMQAAFEQTKGVITSTFTDAAQVTVPFFVQAMSRIGLAVQRLEPQFQAAFAALNVPMESLTTGIIYLAQNAMPGLVRAVQNSGPVFDGLRSLLASIGTGIGQFFSILSQHSTAGGQVFSALGQAIGALLPILAQLVGAGAELAANILPPIAAALQGVGKALSFVAPVLPAVLAGFLGFKAVTALPAILSRFGAVGAAAGAQVSRLGAALPVIGIAVAGLAMAMQAGSQQVDSWGKALLDGGDAAEQAAAQMKHIDDVTQAGLGGLHSWGDVWDRIKALTLGTTDAQKKGADEARALYKAMSPLEQAGQDVTKAQNDYLAAVAKFGPASGQAAGAAVTYRDAMSRQKSMEDQLSTAIHGVTQAMIDQANEALAAADSNFAYQQDVLNTKDAEAALKDTIKQHGASSEETQRATLGLGQALLSQSEAAGKLAADQSGLTDQTDLTRVSQQATLAELLKLKAQYGAEFPASLQQTIDKLQAAGVKLDDVGAKKPTPTVNLNATPFNSIYSYVNGAINTLHGKKPTPTAFMNTQPFGGAAASMNSMLAYLASRHITPSASLIAYTLAAEQALDNAARNRTSYVTQYYVTGGIGSRAAAATGGKVGDVVGRRYDVGGKIRGPGGPTDDMVQAMTGGGVPLRVSNDEWVIKGSSSAKYGDYKMAAINDGRAVISVPGSQPATRFATGGSPSGSGDGGIVIQQLQVHVHNAPGSIITDQDIPRSVLSAFQQGIRKLDRSLR